jgi:hypothetical protein
MNLMTYMRNAVDENYLLFQCPATLIRFNGGESAVVPNGGAI